MAMINVVTLSASEAQRLLESGKLTSVELVEAYLSQIDRHNHHGLELNAIISLVPREKVLATARQLDAERSGGRTRGPLHGIPFVFKDVFTTHPDLGLPCTCGAPCFETAKARRTAPLIQHLIDSGMIILGTANMTEFCGLKYGGCKVGYSPVGGQTQSPYVLGGVRSDDGIVGHSSPGGSSSGSAVSLAAGFAPLAIGTECVGSLTLPTSRAGLYSLKCGLNTVDATGSFHYSDVTDYIGGMAKTVEDLASFTAALMKRPEPFNIRGGLDGLKIGFVKYPEWRLPGDLVKQSGATTFDDMERAFHEVKTRFAAAGAEVVEELDLECPKDRFQWKGDSMFRKITFHQLASTNFPSFFDEFEECEVRSITDMIKWNVDHRERCLPREHPYQTDFYDLLHSRMTEEEAADLVKGLRSDGDILLGALKTVNVVVSLAESYLVMYTSGAGCPNACAPLGTVKYSDDNERPFGLGFAAKQGDEGLLLRVLAAFEKLSPERPLPCRLLE